MSVLEYVGVFAYGKVSAIVGYPYTSKTPMALDIAIDIAAGRALERLRVLYIATEGARNARRKAARIAKAKGLTLAELKDWLTIASAPSGFLNAESTAQLIESVRSNRFGALFLDTYGSALDGSIDRNSAAFSDCLKQLGDASDAYSLLFVVLLHCRKDKMRGGKPPSLQDIDGHNSVAGAIQGAIALSRPKDDEKTLIEVSCLRAPDEEFESYGIRWVDVGDQGGEGLRAEPADLPRGIEKSDGEAKDLAYFESQTVRLVLQAIDSSGGTTTMYHVERSIKTGLGREAKEALMWKLQREGLLEINAVGSSQQISRAGRTPRAAEALAKRSGFLGPGKKNG